MEDGGGSGILKGGSSFKRSLNKGKNLDSLEENGGKFWHLVVGDRSRR